MRGRFIGFQYLTFETGLQMLTYENPNEELFISFIIRAYTLASSIE